MDPADLLRGALFGAVVGLFWVTLIYVLPMKFGTKAGCHTFLFVLVGLGMLISISMGHGAGLTAGVCAIPFHLWAASRYSEREAAKQRNAGVTEMREAVQQTRDRLAPATVAESVPVVAIVPTPLPEGKLGRFCRQCGTAFAEGDRFCGDCGAKRS